MLDSFLSEISWGIQDMVNNPIPSLLLILNLIIIESILSIDNASVLASMVLKLPKEDRKKALFYGIIGAYFFRGICLIFATYLLQFWWLKIIGGLYLLYLFLHWYRTRNKAEENPNEEAETVQKSWLYRNSIGKIGVFWTSVISIEIMDLAFSIDNVFAAAAMSKNIVLIWIGVFIGILAMRFVAQFFLKLLEDYPFLETCAFIVIGILGLKLCLTAFEYFFPEHVFSKILQNHITDWIFSGITFLIFVIPILVNKFIARK